MLISVTSLQAKLQRAYSLQVNEDNAAYVAFVIKTVSDLKESIKQQKKQLVEDEKSLAGGPEQVMKDRKSILYRDVVKVSGRQESLRRAVEVMSMVEGPTIDLKDVNKLVGQTLDFL